MRSLNRLNPYRVRHPLSTDAGDQHNGAFLIPLRGDKILVIASDGLGWDHVSVSLAYRCPTWLEMKAIKELFFEDHECVLQYHPPKLANISIHDYCLHMWRPQHEEIPMPESILV
jgi:hypothetical protein